MIGILGGTGLIGGEIARELCARGVPCAVLARHHHASDAPVQAPAGSPAPLHVLGDVRDTATVSSFVAPCDAVVFAVSHLLPNSPETEVGEFLHWMPEHFERVLSACLDAQVRHFLLVSSGGTVYGDMTDGRRLREDMPLMPRSPYGALSATLEHLTWTAHRRNGLPITVLRLGNVYGRLGGRREGQGLVETILWRAATEQAMVIYGNGSESRDYVWVEEVAARICDVLALPATNDLYNLATGVGTSTAEVLDLTVRTFGLPPFRVDWRDRRSGDVARVVLDPGRFVATFAKGCEIGLSEGLERYRRRLEAVVGISPASTLAGLQRH
jgi:UDP-glucose 4-epimerase